MILGWYWLPNSVLNLTQKLNLLYVPKVKYVLLFSLLNPVRFLATPWTAAHQSSLSFTVSRSLLKLMSVDSLMSSNHLILYGHLLLLPSIFPIIRVFSNESALHIRWSNYCSFSFSISLSNEYSGLISFRIDWFDLLAVQKWSIDHLNWYIYSQSRNLAKSGWDSVLFLYQSNKPLPLPCTVADTEMVEWQGHGHGP